MRALSIAIMTLTMLAGTGLAAPSSQEGPVILKVRPQRRPGQVRILRAPDIASIQEVIEGFYVSRFQMELELDDEQFARVLPRLRNSLRERNEAGQRHARALNQLRQAMRADASDDEIARRIEEIDESDIALRAIQVNLLRSVDPDLSPRQRARLRIVQPNLEERIRNMIERSRGRPPQAPRPPQPPR